MKKLYITAISFFVLSAIYGQKNEYSLNLNSGLFSFGGSSAEKNSILFYYDGDLLGHSYTNNPYGSKNGLCYGISGTLKHISKKKFIAGAELGYERLRSKITITDVVFPISSSIPGYAVTGGKTFLNYDFINLHPYLGRRYTIKSTVNIDLTAGMDFAFCLGTREKGTAPAPNGIKYTTSVDRKTINTDFRPRLQMAAGYKKYGVYAGYSFGGLKNYKSGYVGGVNECYGRLWRFGVSYLL